MSRSSFSTRAATIAVAVGATAWAIATLVSEEPPAPPAGALQVADILGDDAGGFLEADHVRPFHFPRDHGPHPGYRNEWWYFTGNLETEQGRPFGFQLTFFRTALRAEDDSSGGPQRSSAWATPQVYLAHLAVTDVAAGEFHAFERLSRQALGLSGAQSAPFRVWLEDWGAASEGEALFPLHLLARQDGIAIDLRLSEAKPLVLQGNQGLSAKTATEGHASYYYSYTRMATRGSLDIEGQRFSVSGTSWLDREWGSSALGRTQVGWDWFAIQLDDGTDWMLAQVREHDGAPPFTVGSVVSPNGELETLDASEIELQVGSHWQSPATGTRYPASWRVDVPSRDLVLEVEPALPDQELRLSILYWEGATRVRGTHGGVSVTGVGYTELTGYAAAPHRGDSRQTAAR